MADQNVSIGFSATGQAVLATVTNLDIALQRLGRTAATSTVSLEAMTRALVTMGARGASSTARLNASLAQQQAALNASSAASAAMARQLAALEAAAAAAAARLASINLRAGEATRRLGETRVAGEATGSMFTGLAGKAAVFLGITTGLAAIGNEMRKVVTQTMDFTAAMSGVAAVGGITKLDSEFAKLEATAADVGATTKFTATEAALGLRELVAAGMSAEQSMSGLRDVVDLSIAGEMDMARASEIVVASLSAFGFAASETARITDVLARAANASPASVNDLGESLKFVAPVAAALKAPIEDVGAALTALANYGVRGGMAGRGLTAVLSRMIAPTKDVQEIMAKMGVSLDSLNPSIVGLEGAFNKLKSFDQQTLVKMFGAENLDISNILAMSANKFPMLAAKMRDTKVTAAGMAETMSDNLTGAFKGLASSLEGTRIAMGKVFEGSMTDTVKDLTNWVRENREAFVNLSATVTDYAPGILKVTAAYIALRMGMKGVGMALSVGKWIAETAAVLANNRALLSNAALRARVQRRALSRMGVGPAMAAFLTADVASTMGGAFGSGRTRASVMKGLGVLGLAAGAAVVGWQLGKYIEKSFDLGGKLSNAIYGELQILQTQANSALKDASEGVLAAGSPEALAAAKASIEQSIAEWRQKAVGLSGMELQLVRDTVAALSNKLVSADRINAAAVNTVELTKQEAAAREQARIAVEAQAYAEEQAAKRRFQLTERQQKTGKNAIDIQKELLKEAVPEAQLIDVSRSEKGILQLSNYYRKQINAMAADSNVAMVNGGKELKTVDEVVAYFRAAMQAAGKSGSLDFKGSSELNALSKLATKSMELSGIREAAQAKVAEREKKEQEQAENKVMLMKEIAVEEAKAAGNDAKAKRLEREMAIMKEQKSIMTSLGIGEKQALALATRKVNAAEAAKEAEKKDKTKDVQVVASSMAEIGGGGGVFLGGMQGVQQRMLTVQETSMRHLSDIALRLGVNGNSVLPPTVGNLSATEQTNLLSRMAAALDAIHERGRRGAQTGGLQVEIL